MLGFILMGLMTPLYVNMTTIYSLANLNDVSWGTRESKKSASTNLDINRTTWFIGWLFANSIFGYAVYLLSQQFWSVDWLYYFVYAVGGISTV